MDLASATTQAPTQVLTSLASRSAGLAPAEVADRLRREGPNRLPGQTIRWWQILFRQFRSAFVYLLVGAAGLSLLLGEVVDGLLIVLFILINAVLGFYQEHQSERTLNELQRFVRPRTRVRRAGREEQVDSELIVPGDLVILEPGDRGPADLRLIETTDLVVDESVLTGESVTVEKTPQPLAAPTAEPGGAVNLVFAGTTVVSGGGLGVVVLTGPRSTLGQLARLTLETEREGTFERSLRNLSRFVLRLTAVTLALVYAGNLLLKGPAADPVELLIFAIALAVSVIPEALLVVTTFSLTRGARELARHHVVVKRLSSIEDLGSIEVLCTDKTGTLTKNELRVAAVSTTDEAALITAAALALHNPGAQEPSEPFDRAIWERLTDLERQAVRRADRLASVPFDPERRRVSVLVRRSGDEEVIVRGAPETVLDLCEGLDSDQRQLAEQWAADRGQLGQRVLAVAHRRGQTAVEEDLEALEQRLSFLGLIAFTDPLKLSARQAVPQARALGVRIVILTGDSPEVAAAVAREIGLIRSADEVMTGQAFDRLPVDEQTAALDRLSVFARVTPQQKFRIIALLEHRFEVGFLGEGINDAPALKRADVGVVVQGAAEIARQAADLLLLERNLTVLIEGIRLGRQAFANTTKYLKATLASNFGNFYAVGLASFLIVDLPFLPIQLLLINLLSDFPMIAVATDRVDPVDLHRPRHYDLKRTAFLATVLGVVSTVFDFIVFVLFSRISLTVLQTNWFVASILTELAFLFSIRTRYPVWRARPPSGTVVWLTLVAALVTLVLPFTDPGQSFFHFTPPTGRHLLLIVSLVALYFVVSESVKILYYRLTNHRRLSS